MVIMEMTVRRMELINEYAERVLRYAGRLMTLLDEHAGDADDNDEPIREEWRYGERRRHLMR